MSRLVRTGVVALALIALPTGLVAQALGGTNRAPRIPPSETPLDRFGPLSTRQFQVTSGTEDDTASVALEISRWNASPTPVRGQVATRRVIDTLNLIVSTPLNGEDEAMPATLDGLANGTRATLRWGRWVSYTARQNPPAAAAIYARAQQRCRDTENAEDVRRRASLGNNPQPDVIEAINKVHADALKVCDDETGSPQNFVERQSPRELWTYTALIRPADLRQFGAEVSVGRNGFDFVDPVTLQEDSERHIQWSARAFYTQYLRGSKTALTFSAGYERAYKAADEQIFCPSNPTNVTIACTTARGAPPSLDDSLLLSAGFRHQFSRDGLLANVAIAPLVTYDVLDDVVGVDVPVYLVPNSDGGLTGGVRFGYRSDRDDHFSIGVFIGAAFSILQGG